MLVIGLTGGIGSGKTTVTSLFSQHGITIIDTDRLARDLTQPGYEALNKIATHFGKNILLPDGSLNRKTLRHIVFSDTNQRLWLEQLLHPLIQVETEALIQSAKSPYVIVVIPLLFETEYKPSLKRILVVDASEEQQIERAQKRDQSTLEETQAILKLQTHRSYRLEHATDIIYNTGIISDLNQQVDKLHSFYLSLCDKK